MAILLDLGGEGGTAGGLSGQAEAALQLAQRGLGETRPIDGGVGMWPLQIEQAAVFDEQQAERDKRGNVFEAGVELVRVDSRGSSG